MISITASDIEAIIVDDLDALRFLTSTRPSSPERHRLLRVLDRMPDRIARSGPFPDREAMIALALAEINGALTALQALG
jgi:hypothetical protein